MKYSHKLILGTVTLTLSMIWSVRFFNVNSKAIIPLINFHVAMIQEGIVPPMSYTYTVRFREGETDEALGVAYGMFDENHVQVLINKAWWDILSPNERNILLYHEFGHDILGIKHQFCDKNSIMYPNRQGMIKKDADVMLHELLLKYKDESLGCPWVFFWDKHE